MPRYRVFLGSPSPSPLPQSARGSRWHTRPSREPVLTPSPHEASANRWSAIFKDVIFPEGELEENSLNSSEVWVEGNVSDAQGHNDSVSLHAQRPFKLLRMQTNQLGRWLPPSGHRHIPPNSILRVLLPTLPIKALFCLNPFLVSKVNYHSIPWSTPSKTRSAISLPSTSTSTVCRRSPSFRIIKVKNAQKR